jgi:hypothetical protein
MAVEYHADLVQGSDEWLDARCGLLTASQIDLIITPTLKFTTDKKERAHLYELLAQRVTGHVEPAYISDDMLRGQIDETEARILYAETHAPVTEVGFITNDKWGVKIGYSPDGLVGEDGLIECKSRRQKYHIQTMLENLKRQTVPADHLLQVQTGLLVSEREWLDFVSYCGGMHMLVIRVWPDKEVQDAIIAAALAFEGRLAQRMDEYKALIELGSGARLTPTERRIDGEIII